MYYFFYKIAGQRQKQALNAANKQLVCPAEVAGQERDKVGQESETWPLKHSNKIGYANF